MIFLPITHSRFGINSPIFPALKTAQNKDHIFSLSPMGRNLKMTKPQGEGWLTPAKPENATSVQLTSFGGFVFLFTDVILTVQSATRFFRASSEADCVTFVAGLTPTKDDDAASVDFGR